jgi:hypothetical protein
MKGAPLAVGSKLPNRGSGFPLQSFAAETAAPIGATVSHKSISASIPSANRRRHSSGIMPPLLRLARKLAKR